MAKPDTEGKEEIETVSIDSARDTLGDLVIRAGVADERIMITRHGRPTAVLVGLRDFERLRELDEANAAA